MKREDPRRGGYCTDRPQAPIIHLLLLFLLFCCICMYISMHTYICMFVDMQMYICMFVVMQMYICMYVGVQLCMCRGLKCQVSFFIISRPGLLLYPELSILSSLASLLVPWWPYLCLPCAGITGTPCVLGL